MIPIRSARNSYLFKTDGKAVFCFIPVSFLSYCYLQAPVKKGDIVGEAQYLLDGKLVGKTDIVAAKSVEKAGLWDYIKRIGKKMTKGGNYWAGR